MNKSLLLLFILCSSMLFQACSKANISQEDEIRQYIESGVKAAENRSAGDVADLIDESYSDEKGLDKKQIKKMLRVYFFRHKNIFLLTRIRDITIYSEDEASVTLYVAMAGSVISDASMLANLRARTYKFELELVKQDEWLLKKAKWHAAGLADFQK